MATSRPSPLVFPAPSPSPSPATLILVPGYADVPSGFAQLAHLPSALHSDARLQHVKLVIPWGLPSRHASVPTTVWFDMPIPVPLPGLQPGSKPGYVADMEQVEANLDYFEELVRLEIEAGTRPGRIAFLGYSQSGGMVVLFMMTRQLGREIGGVVSVAGFPFSILEEVGKYVEKKIEEKNLQKEKNVPLLLAHGTRDNFVPMWSYTSWKEDLESSKAKGLGPRVVDGALLDMGHVFRDCVWEAVIPWLEEKIPRDGKNSKL